MIACRSADWARIGGANSANGLPASADVAFWVETDMDVPFKRNGMQIAFAASNQRSPVVLWRGHQAHRLDTLIYDPQTEAGL